MTQSYQAPGSTLSLVAPYARATSGLGAKIGGIFGVSCDTVANGATGQFQIDGVHALTKTASQAWTLGDRVYWDDTNKRCDNDSTVGMFIGLATVAVGSGAGETTGYVVLCPGAELFEGAQTAIADISTADGSDAGTTQALANAIKAKFNTLLAELRLNGVLKT